MPNKSLSALPPLCPQCKTYCRESLLSNEGEWLAILFSCTRCDYSVVQHYDRPLTDGVESIRDMMTGASCFD